MAKLFYKLKLFSILGICCLVVIYLLPNFSKQDNKSSLEKDITSIPQQDGVSFSKNDNPYLDKKEWKTFMEALERYKIFHGKKMKLLKQSPDGANVRTLTWACSQATCSGIGDQLFRIQYFLLLAMMSDRVFTVYWDKGLKKTTDYLLPNEIDWGYFSWSKGMCDDASACSHRYVYDRQPGPLTLLWGFTWTKKEFSRFGEVLFDNSVQHITVTGRVAVRIMYIGNLSFVDPGELITEGMKGLGVQQILTGSNTNTTVYCGGGLSTWYNMLHFFGIHHIMDLTNVHKGVTQATDPWMYAGHTLFNYLFLFTGHLAEKLKEYQMSLGLYKTDYLALHLRTCFLGSTDQDYWLPDVKHFGLKCFRPQYWDCFLQYAITLKNKMLGPGAPIYLSTDSDILKDKMRLEYGDKNIVFGDLTIIHSRMKHADNEIEFNGHLDMWLDFLSMANAQMIVHSQSSFSINSAFVKPIAHSLHSWVLHDNERDCLAAYAAGNVTCICR